MVKSVPNSSSNQSLKKKFLIDTSPCNILQYDIYLENLFCCPDLLVYPLPEKEIVCLLLKREEQRKERGATALPLSFVSQALEKDTRFLNPALGVSDKIEFTRDRHCEEK